VPTKQISIDEAIEIFREMGVNVPRAMSMVAKNIVLDAIDTGMRKLKNDILSVRTGTLRRYVPEVMMQTLEEMPAGGWRAGVPKGTMVKNEQTGMLSPLGVIARVHEGPDDTVVTAKEKLLRVPLPPALTGSQVDKMAGVSLKDVPQDPPFRFIPADEGGDTVGYLARGRGDESELWYTLRRRVTIPARHWWSQALHDVVGRIPQHVNLVLPKALRSEKLGTV
jgi:hypothetical protein